MEIKIDNGIRIMSLDLIATVTLAVLVLLFGYYVKNKVKILR